MIGFRSVVLQSFYVPSGSMEPTLRIGDRIFAAKYAYGWRLPFTRIPLGSLEVPQRGDVVVFTRPIEDQEDAWWSELDIAGLVPARDYVKRVAAVAGDTVAVRNGVVVIDGRPTQATDQGPYRYVDQSCTTMQTRRLLTDEGPSRVILQATQAHRRQPDWGPETVPSGHVFVLGDNRDRSKDSRSFGFVPVRDIKGKALRVWASRPLCTPGDTLPGMRWKRVGKQVN